MKVVAIVPARGGSKGVPKKNIRLLAGYPLIAYAVLAGKLAGNIDRVIVSTDSQDIAGYFFSARLFCCASFCSR